MSNSKVKVIFLIFFIFAINIAIICFCNLERNFMTLSYEVKSNNTGIYQIFYTNCNEFSQDKSVDCNYSISNQYEILKFDIPVNTDRVRFDFGEQTSEIYLKNIKLTYLGKSFNLNYDQLLDYNNWLYINNVSIIDNNIYIQTKNYDPYIVYNLDRDLLKNILSYKSVMNIVVKILLCIVVDLVLVLVFKKLNIILLLANDLFSSKKLIWKLAKNDFKTKYAGSYLGIIWAFVQPMTTIIVYWVVFEFGLRATSPNIEVPFILWFSTGLIPWFFFSEALMNATNSLLEYSYLVKKIVFKVSILPIVKIISSLFVHLSFLAFGEMLCIFYKQYSGIYMIQLIYYLICGVSLVLALSYSTCAIVLFFRDLGQILNIVLQIGMWMTPIMWSYNIVPNRYLWIVKLNPMFYIVEGYRDTFINKIWFFDKYYQTVYFWVVTIVLFLIGNIIYKKLKPHFADVL